MPRVVLVTGGTRGIGRAIAQRFSDAGDVVVVGGRSAPVDLPWPCVPGDVRDPEQAAAVVKRVVEEHGALDVLVNNAGGSPPADTATASARFTEAILRLNLVAPYVLAQRANEVMQAQPGGGVIVNVCSVAALRGSPTTAAYGAAKAGLVQLTQTLAIEWAPKVRVCAVSPGLVWTEASGDHYPEADAVAATVPLGRFASPADVAHAVAFLASAEASYASGCNLVLDGGGQWPAFLRHER